MENCKKKETSIKKPGGGVKRFRKVFERKDVDLRFGRRLGICKTMKCKKTKKEVRKLVSDAKSEAYDYL